MGGREFCTNIMTQIQAQMACRTDRSRDQYARELARAAGIAKRCDLRPDELVALHTTLGIHRR